MISKEDRIKAAIAASETVAVRTQNILAEKAPPSLLVNTVVGLLKAKKENKHPDYRARKDGAVLWMEIMDCKAVQKMDITTNVRMTTEECAARALQAKIDLERIRAERNEQNGISQEALYVQPV